MSRRSRRRVTMLGVSALAVAALALPSQVAAKASASANIQEPSPCQLTGTYSWTGVNKPHVQAGFEIVTLAFDRVEETVLVNTSEPSGSVSSQTPTQGTFGTSYGIRGFLVDKRGKRFMLRTDQLQSQSNNCD